DQKQHESFEQSFIKLRWVARHGPTLRKDHCPRDRGRPAEQFAIDEITDAAEPEPDRCYGTAEVRNFPEIPALLSGNPDCRQNHSNETAVKRHAALPDRENRKRLANISAEVVEQHIPEAAADHDAKDEIEEQVVQVVRR